MNEKEIDDILDNLQKDYENEKDPDKKIQKLSKYNIYKFQYCVHCEHYRETDPDNVKGLCVESTGSSLTSENDPIERKRNDTCYFKVSKWKKIINLEYSRKNIGVEIIDMS
ncbi:MAG: hypothetical protein JRJ76_01355 [Deltaproteobacteria bacterium]|nr:hypothetical protein [Deltaproteobacteria bacterium]